MWSDGWTKIPETDIEIPEWKIKRELAKQSPYKTDADIAKSTLCPECGGPCRFVGMINRTFDKSEYRAFAVCVDINCLAFVEF
jgi:hypothetical protein